MEFELSFKRTNFNEFPKVYKECICKSKIDGSKSIHIIIQDVPPELHEDLVEFYVKYYLPDEPCARTTKLIEDEQSLEAYKIVFSMVLLQNLSIVALTDGDDGKPKIVGGQLYTVSSLDDSPFPELPGVALAKLRKMYHTIKSEELIASLNITNHLHDWGLSVDPQYRRMGIAEEILKVGEDLGKLIEVNNIITIFTSIYSQRIAERLGYRTLNQIIYKEYRDEQGNRIFPGEDKTEYLKLMHFTL